MIHYLWAPGTWEVDMFKNENPGPDNVVGLGLWLFDQRFPDRLPKEIFKPFMLCPPGYAGSFGPIPAFGPSNLNPFSALRNPSYEDSVLGGVDYAVAQIRTLPIDARIIIGGYSQGAHLAELLKKEFLPGGRLADYKLLACYTFGPPGRKKGLTFPNGNVLPWGGITGLEIPCPDGCLERSYAFYDDMYANANPDSYLFDFYDTLTDLSFRNPWESAQKMITDIGKTDLMQLAGAKPFDIKWIITHVPFFVSSSRKAINTLDAAARFASSGAHGHYHDWEIIPGYTPIFHSIRSAKYLAKGLGYAVPGI